MPKVKSAFTKLKSLVGLKSVAGDVKQDEKELENALLKYWDDMSPEQKQKFGLTLQKKLGLKS